MYRPTKLTIHREALLNNVNQLLALRAPAQIFCPMLKANAYGHGLVPIARELQAHFSTVANMFLGVALVEEGMALREAGIRLPILAFSPWSKAAMSAAMTHAITPVLCRPEDLQVLGQVGGRVPIDVHVELNTGMQRLGFDFTQIEILRTFFSRHTNFKVQGVATHFTHGDDFDAAHGPSQLQLELMDQFLVQLDWLGRVAKHVHKSASFSGSRAEGVRPGLALYGLSGGLTPVMTWTSRLEIVRQVQQGTSVSYNGRWMAKRPSTIGVVPVGYGDGYRRDYFHSDGAVAHMLVGGHRVPVVGSVCMDYTMVDLTDVPGSVLVGDEVVLLGHQGNSSITAEELANVAGTISYEVVTGISARVPREVV